MPDRYWQRAALLALLALGLGGAVVGSSSTILRTAQASPPRFGIEAGHGGRDPGSLSCDRTKTEASVTLAVALKAADLLRQRGYTVDVFRGDAPGTLPKSQITGYQGTAFVALHNDYCAPGQAGYKVARYGGSPGTGKNGSGDASDRLVDNLWSSFAATGLSRDTSPGHFTASMLQYYALNPSGDGALLTSTDGQNRMAKGIADSLLQFSTGIQPSTPSTSCSQAGCNGQDPVQMGCAADAYTVDAASASVPVYGGGVGGSVTATVELRWSPSCQTNWAKMTTSGGVTDLRFFLRDRNNNIIDATSYQASGTAVYGNMWYAPTGQVYVKACGQFLGKEVCTGLY